MINPSNKKEQVILIVDDVPINLELLGSVLVENNYKVAIATGGLQAIKVASNIKPDLILLDVSMPGMDGFEVCKILKQQDDTKSISIIFLTAKNDFEDIIQGFDFGAVDYITKPFRIPELLARVKTHLELKRSRDIIQFQFDELTKLKERAEADSAALAQLNFTKDKFFSIIAHDLRNPFTGLIGFSTLIAEESETIDREDLKHMANLLANSSKNMLSLLNNLLDWARIQTNTTEYKLNVVNLNSIVENILSLYELNIKQKGLVLKIDIPDKLNALASESILASIFQNLLTNAIKFTNRGGKIEIYALMRENHVEVSVSDSGIGISTDRLSTIFDIVSYSSTTGTEDELGSGLGLILVKELVNICGGSLTVNSALGKGTNFTFTLNKA